MRHEREKLLRNKAIKHRIPPKLVRNAIWGMDTTVVADEKKFLHHVMGLIDHGTRLNLCLRRLGRFNTWTCLGCIFFAIGEFGKPKTITLDNHPVFRSRLLKTVLGAAGIRLWFSEPGKPWQNGRIERFFGTLKAAMHGHVFEDQAHVLQAMAEFQCWYNLARVHQHLRGRTPAQAWLGIDPHLIPPKTVKWVSAWGGRLRGTILRF